MIRSSFKLKPFFSKLCSSFSTKIPSFVNFVELSNLTKIEEEQLISSYEDLFEQRIEEPYSSIPKENLELLLMEKEVDYELIEGEEEQKRPIIATIMGHVDHGKTTLLDAFRNSALVDNEFGKITQSIGAFTVKLQNNRVTFIDTPGHQAFTNMRERGAEPTDLVILVVCGVEGVQNQTREAFEIASKAGVPIIIAVNKIDRQQYDWETSLDNLLVEGYNIEPRGGDIPVIPISAFKKHNLDVLEAKLDEMTTKIDPKALANGIAEGFVVESKVLERKSGGITSASVIIQKGMLKIGDVFLCGDTWGKIRTMNNDKGESIEEGFPGEAVEISGFKESPMAGSQLVQMEATKAELIAKQRIKAKEMEAMENSALKDTKGMKLGKMKTGTERHLIMRRGLKSLLRNRIDQVLDERSDVSLAEVTRIKEVYLNKESTLKPVIIKADTEGVLETILNELEYSFEEEYIRKYLIDFSVGMLSERDFKVQI